MTPAAYARAITGMPHSRVTYQGRPVARGALLRHADGTRWRYEGLSANNTSVAASRRGELRRFSFCEFGFAVVVSE